MYICGSGSYSQRTSSSFSLHRYSFRWHSIERQGRISRPGEGYGCRAGERKDTRQRVPHITEVELYSTLHMNYNKEESVAGVVIDIEVEEYRNDESDSILEIVGILSKILGVSGLPCESSTRYFSLQIVDIDGLKSKTEAMNDC